MMKRFDFLLCVLWLAAGLAANMNEAIAEPASEDHSVTAAEETPTERRLHEKGFELGAPVFIRIFKQPARLELWVAKGGRFELFDTYAICRFSGGLGPKIERGDRQSPEGVYSITSADLIINARWHRAMNVNYPNGYDLALGRTGSGILIHGKCTSIGCFAMTDNQVEEIYTLVSAALEAGQPHVLVHVLPFPLTAENLAAHANNEWIGFWRELRPAYTFFERDRLPPKAMLCGEHYGFEPWRKEHTWLPLQSLKALGCKPLETVRPVFASAARKPGALQQQPEISPAERAKTCDPRTLQCRMLRVALASPAPCPKKYARCRNSQTAAIKSVDCPLKYPRCRKRGISRVTTAKAQ